MIRLHFLDSELLHMLTDSGLPDSAQGIADEALGDDSEREACESRSAQRARKGSVRP